MEDFERGDPEGLTCIAKIGLNELGEPQWDAVSVSTAPWALGRLKSLNPNSLDFESFEAGIKELQAELSNFQARRIKPTPDEHQENDVKPVPKVSMPLVRGEIEDLLKVFYSWAQFSPSSKGVPAIVIKAKAANEPKKKTVPEITAQGEDLKETFSLLIVEEDESDDDADEDEQIEILNSFYAKDIQRALVALGKGQLSPALKAYLSPIAKSKRVSVYQQDGKKDIHDRLHPRHLPPGRWLGEPHHLMSLMQQFSINEAAKALESGGIFAVNGPPGTGKTTLLRDIFADIITQRARVLAGLSSAVDAYEKDAVLIEFKGEQPRKISRLREELTGFEIVVASTNNAAVENISRDLPKTRALGEQKGDQRQELTWRNSSGIPKTTYLRTIAAKYAARNAKGGFDPLSVDDNPWGLIACALGNSKNRRRFCDAVFSATIIDGELPPGCDPKIHKSFWEWRASHKGPTFLEAAASFNRADKEVRERQALLDQYINAFEQTKGVTFDAYIFSERTSFNAADSAWILATKHLSSITDGLTALDIRLADIEALRKLNPKPKLPIADLLFNSAAREQHRLAKASYDKENEQYDRMQRETLLARLELNSKKHAAELAVDDANATRGTAHERLAKSEAQWVEYQNALTTLEIEFPKVRAQLESGIDIEEEAIQKSGLWPDPRLNALRSSLFAAALSLHEAWLAEVSKTGVGFGANMVGVSNLIRGKHLLDPSHAKLLWQSLFMMVPVVSTTFASVARQFKDLGPDSLGWLFIDEAGQAVPQAAVGALSRCKRAMVVGDPLQIEPVFTVPAKLIAELEKHSDVVQHNVAPNRRSVQNLSDEATPFGASVPDISSDSGETWVGSPLRVHRRCSDPMFSVANAIAYENKMIFGAANKAPPNDSINLGPSAWVQLSGATENKQVVPVQIDYVVESLVTLARSIGSLPPVYVISPFRRIATTLKSRLRETECWGELAGSNGKRLTKTELKNWCKSNIGTVHTFQGKQAPIVWMVLGCDTNSIGAVTWASMKPNILNVALTRAEHRFFMFGDFNVWGSRQNFNALRAPVLQKISPEEFMARLKIGHEQTEN